MTKELLKKAKEYFEAYPTVGSFCVTTDGQFFQGANAGYAKDHQRNLNMRSSKDGDIQVVRRSDIDKPATPPKNSGTGGTGAKKAGKDKDPLKEARAKYKELYDKKAYNGWDLAKLNELIAAKEKEIADAKEDPNAGGDSTDGGKDAGSEGSETGSEETSTEEPGAKESEAEETDPK